MLKFLFWLAVFADSIFYLLFCLLATSWPLSTLLSSVCSHWRHQMIAWLPKSITFFNSILLPPYLNLVLLLRLVVTSALKLFHLGFCDHFLLLSFLCLWPLYIFSVFLSLYLLTSVLLFQFSYSSCSFCTDMHEFIYLQYLHASQICISNPSVTLSR